MSTDVPTLSTSGWLGDPYYKAAQILSYFFASNASQSNLYIGRVRALSELIQRLGNDPLALEQEIKTALTEMLTPHFDNVELTVKITTKTVENSVDENIVIDALLVDKGKTYTLGRLITVVDSKVMEIVEINNG